MRDTEGIKIFLAFGDLLYDAGYWGMGILVDRRML